MNTAAAVLMFTAAITAQPAPSTPESVGRTEKAIPLRVSMRTCSFTLADGGTIDLFDRSERYLSVICRRPVSSESTTLRRHWSHRYPLLDARAETLPDGTIAIVGRETLSRANHACSTILISPSGYELVYDRHIKHPRGDAIINSTRMEYGLPEARDLSFSHDGRTLAVLLFEQIVSPARVGFTVALYDSFNGLPLNAARFAVDFDGGPVRLRLFTDDLWAIESLYPSSPYPPYRRDLIGTVFNREGVVARAVLKDGTDLSSRISDQNTAPILGWDTGTTWSVRHADDGLISIECRVNDEVVLSYTPPAPEPAHTSE